MRQTASLSKVLAISLLSLIVAAIAVRSPSRKLKPYQCACQPPIVPDGFLSLGVDRFLDEEGRLSYVLWEEDGIAPILALEAVSKTYGGEYEQKKVDYAQLGVLYYVIYVPSRRYRRKRLPLEVYRLVDG